MAIFHLSVTAYSRSNGHSATAAAAYRSGIRLVDERSGITHDYTRRAGVAERIMVMPEGAPSWDRAQLWNNAEQAETRKNSCVAREVRVAIPIELTPEQGAELTRRYTSWLVDRFGFAADASIHTDDGNPHAHILTTTRRVGPSGLGEKCRELDSAKTGSAEVLTMRQTWERMANTALELAGRPERIDHRSNAAIGRDDLPTVHVGHGPGAHARAQHNRDVRELNQAMRQALQERAQEAARIKAAEAEAFARTSVVFRPAEAPERPPEPTSQAQAQNAPTEPPEPVDLDALADERRRIDERDAEIQRRLDGLKASMESASKASRRAEQLAERARRERAALADLKRQRAGLSWWGRLTRGSRLDEQISQAQAQLSATCQAGRQAQAKATTAEVLQARARELEQERAAAQARRDEIVALATAGRARLAGLHLPRTPTPGTRAAKA